MITLIRPILFSFINSEKVKRLIVDLLKKLAESTENSLDDEAAAFIERGLFGEVKE
jgi:type IV secretory pathway VirB4 component